MERDQQPTMRKKNEKVFIKTFLSSLINHAPLWRNGKGVNNDEKNNNN